MGDAAHYRNRCWLPYAKSPGATSTRSPALVGHSLSHSATLAGGIWVKLKTSASAQLRPRTLAGDVVSPIRQHPCNRPHRSRQIQPLRQPSDTSGSYSDKRRDKATQLPQPSRESASAPPYRHSCCHWCDRLLTRRCRKIPRAVYDTAERTNRLHIRTFSVVSRHR